MEITPEQVTKVCSCTGATDEEARAALEETGGNVLDAVILLEQRGKGGPAGGGYSTRSAGPEPEPEAPGWRKPSWDEVKRALKSIVANCLAISLEIWKSGRMTCMIPLIIALILCLLEPYLMFGLALVGLCFGYRIHVSGKGTEEWGGRVNRVMDQIGDTVSDAVASIFGDRNKKGKK